MKKGFNAQKYLEEQSKFIIERVNHYDKLYLEFGGKLLFDMHAKRVLPGFDENAKIKLLEKLKDQTEVIVCVYAGDIERNKMRSDFGISYDVDVFKLIDDLRSHGLTVNSVVITRFQNQPSSITFKNKLERKNIKVYIHEPTKGYPNDIDMIVSDEGYGKNPYIETTKPIVVVTGPGPGSGKLSTCLSQLYHEQKRGNKIGYSKFETFPVWNLPIKHPVNIAYEAATVDLKDVNMVDSFHIEAYNEIAVNYNRDIEAFPVLRRIIEKITGEESEYKSPTDMGVNRIAFGIEDDNLVRNAALQEIIRRYYKTACEYKKGHVDAETYNRSKLILDELGLSPLDRCVVEPARKTSEEKGVPVVAIQLSNGHMITGKSSEIMNASASAIINAVKYHAKIDDNIHLLSPAILDPILKLKKHRLSQQGHSLNCEEVLIALSISAAFNPIAQVALDKLKELKNTEAHSTVMLDQANEQIYRSLGIEITADPEFSSNRLFYSN